MKRKLLPSVWGLAVLALTLSGHPRAYAQAAAPGGLATDEVGLKLDVDKREVEVGDSLTVTLEFRRMGGGGQIVSQRPSIPAMESFDIQGNSSSTQIMMINGQMTEVSKSSYRLTALKPGEVTIGPALMIVQDAQLGKRELKSNTALVTVKPKRAFKLFGHSAHPAPTAAIQAPSAATPDDLKDIKGVQPLPSFDWSWLFWAAVALLAGGWIYRRWKRKPVGSVEHPLGSGEALRDRYKKMVKADLDSKTFCREAASLARSALGFRYGFPAEDWTTSEILSELGKYKSGGSIQDSAEKCLKVTDRILYAEGILSSTAREAVLQALSSLMPRTGS